MGQLCIGGSVGWSGKGKAMRGEGGKLSTELGRVRGDMVPTWV